MNFKKYDKKQNYSYTYGVSPTLDMLMKRPDLVDVILLHPDGNGQPGTTNIKQLCDKHHIRWEMAPRAISRISVKENTYAIGVFKKYESSISSTNNHVVLVNPSSPGNLGTIIRSMVGFDIVNLGIVRPAVDIFDPKVVRAAMGSNFDLNFEYFDTFEQYVEKFPTHNLYPFLLNASKEIKEVTFQKPFTLIFGNESSGLPDTFNNVGTSVYIAHSKNIDSLNLSSAATIGLYASRKSM